MNEILARTNVLYDGAWTAKATRTREFLAPPRPFEDGGETLDLEDFVEDDERKNRLDYLLRPHWEGRVERDEIWLRVGLDYALMVPMLMELAIECGYLDAASLRTAAREELHDLLWSSAARRYVAAYDYVSLFYLAQRVDVKIGVPIGHLPPVDSAGETSFATFIEFHRAYTLDSAILPFLKILDHYIVTGLDAGQLYKVLHSDGYERTSSLQRIGLAALRFLEHLAAVWSLAGQSNRAAFGTFYSYWLARYFGYELTSAGYTRNGIDWSEQTFLFPQLADVPFENDDLNFVLDAARGLWESARTSIDRTFPEPILRYAASTYETGMRFSIDAAPRVVE